MGKQHQAAAPLVLKHMISLQHCARERTAAPKFQRVRKGITRRECRRAGFGTPSLTRFCLTSDCSWIRARNATGFQSVARFVFVSPSRRKRRSRALNHQGVWVLSFYLPVKQRRRANVESFRQSGRSAETIWKLHCVYKHIFKKFYERWKFLYIQRSC